MVYVEVTSVLLGYQTMTSSVDNVVCKATHGPYLSSNYARNPSASPSELGHIDVVCPV